MWCSCCRGGNAYSDIVDEEHIESTEPKIVDDERTPLLKGHNGLSQERGSKNHTAPPLNGNSNENPIPSYPNIKLVNGESTSGHGENNRSKLASQDGSASSREFKSIENSPGSENVEPVDDQSHTSIKDGDLLAPSPTKSKDGDDDTLMVIAEEYITREDLPDHAEPVTSTPLAEGKTDPPHSPDYGSEDLDFSLSPEQPKSMLDAKTFSQTVFLDDTLSSLADSDTGDMLPDSPLLGSSPDQDFSSSGTKSYKSTEDVGMMVGVVCDQEESNTTLICDEDSTLSLESPDRIKADFGNSKYSAEGDLVSETKSNGAGSSMSSSPSELWKTVSTDGDGELYTSCTQEPIIA